MTSRVSLHTINSLWVYNKFDSNVPHSFCTLGDQEVKSLKMFCGLDCGWKGELRDIGSHIEKECKNVEVSCSNECEFRMKRKYLMHHLEYDCPRRQYPCEQCGQVNEYRDLKQHLQQTCPKREYLCPKCNEAGCYDERTTTHLEVCPKVKIECPKCLDQIFRCDMSTHPQYCLNEPVPCKYYDIGCMEKPLRKNLKKHEENTQFHLSKATEKVLELTKVARLKNTETFKVANFEKFKKSNDVFYSPNFFTSQARYKLCVSVYANGWKTGEGTHVSVYAHFMKGDNDDSLTWPFTGTVTFELLNQLEDKNHHEKTSAFTADNEASRRVVNEERGMGRGKTKFITHTDLGYQPDKNCQYLKKDSLIFRISVKVPDYKPWLECTL